MNKATKNELNAFVT